MGRRDGRVCQRVFSICGVAVGVEAVESGLIERLSSTWKQLFAVGPVAPHGPPRIYLEFTADLREEAVACRERVFASDELEVWTTDRGYHLRTGKSRLEIDLERERAAGMLDRGFWSSPLAVRREFFLLAFLMLFRRQGMFGVHANAVASAENACLIVGPSGSGKTTLTLSLVRRGWNYLSDDAMMLRAVSKGVEALAFRRGFSLTRQTAERFPELGAAFDHALELSDGKRFVVLDEVYRNRSAERCAPRLILFPRIGSYGSRQTLPLDVTVAMTRLIQQSPGIMTDKPRAAEQLATLKLLLQQARAVELVLGSDLYEDPAGAPQLVERLLGV